MRPPKILIKRGGEFALVLSAVVNIVDTKEITAMANSRGLKAARQWNEGRENYEAFVPRCPRLEEIQQKIQLMLQRVAVSCRICISRPFEVYRYCEGNLVAPHHDATWHDDCGLEMNSTGIVYLNGDYSGGETVIYDLEGKQISFRGSPGDCLLFSHGLLHGGSVVSAGVKDIWRFDASIRLSE